MMADRGTWRNRWLKWEQTLHRHLADRGLSGIADAFSEALRPLMPAIAQLLLVVQPIAGAFGQAQAVDALADLLGGVEDNNTTIEQENPCST